jgi:NADPH:quinone reductase-like Zn-dependent oxidoreductase
MKMKAIVREESGATDVLELRDVDKPEIATDEILIRIHAAGVDRGVWHVMTGLPYPIRMGWSLCCSRSVSPSWVDCKRDSSVQDRRSS